MCTHICMRTPTTRRTKRLISSTRTRAREKASRAQPSSPVRRQQHLLELLGRRRPPPFTLAITEADTRPLQCRPERHGWAPSFPQSPRTRARMPAHRHRQCRRPRPSACRPSTHRRSSVPQRQGLYRPSHALPCSPVPRRHRESPPVLAHFRRSSGPPVLRHLGAAHAAAWPGAAVLGAPRTSCCQRSFSYSSGVLKSGSA